MIGMVNECGENTMPLSPEMVWLICDCSW